MIRIGMMTFLHNDNYGSILQAWALQQTLLDMGFDATHIDYVPSKQEKIRNLLLSGNSPKLILEGMRKKSATSKMHGGFDEFRKENIRATAPCRDHAALKNVAADFDVLVCGSDQIWSPVWLNPAYFLDFTDRPKVSYAPSLGVKDMPNGMKRRKIAKLVKKFSAVSVREQEGANLLVEMEGVEPVIMPDPVMLVDKETWQSIMDQHVPQGKYVLCYFIGDNPSYWETVAAVAQREGCEVRVIPRTEEARNSGYILEEDVPPQRWLGLINGAAHVVTDSFHGATFSAILNKECTIVRRYREDDPESKNSRIDQLLRNLGVSSLNNADWDVVNRNLAVKADSAKSWLKNAINQVKP